MNLQKLKKGNEEMDLGEFSANDKCTEAMKQTNY
jgi:hypothetical protein